VISEDAVVHETAMVAQSARIWGGAVLLPHCSVGEQTVISRNVFIGAHVSVGARCKVKDLSLIYDGAIIEDGVFIGPSCVLTNDKTPRAINRNGSLKTSEDWDLVGVTLKHGASLGAGTICVAPLTIGSWAMVAAGSVVTTNVPAYALFIGSPARHAGWVGRSGKKLRQITSEDFECPLTLERYQLLDGQMRIIESSE
jgi:acetyltransferase-like isoleucine patch superfamily enzyme